MPLSNGGNGERGNRGLGHHLERDSFLVVHEIPSTDRHIEFPPAGYCQSSEGRWPREIFLATVVRKCLCEGVSPLFAYSLPSSSRVSVFLLPRTYFNNAFLYLEYFLI